MQNSTLFQGTAKPVIDDQSAYQEYLTGMTTVPQNENRLSMKTAHQTHQETSGLRAQDMTHDFESRYLKNDSLMNYNQPHQNPSTFIPSQEMPFERSEELLVDITPELDSQIPADSDRHLLSEDELVGIMLLFPELL